MSSLITPSEFDRIQERAFRMRFKADRRNVPAWCLRGLSFVVFVLFTALYLWVSWVDRAFRPNAMLLGAVVHLFAAGLSHLQWSRYQELYVLHTRLNQTSEQDAGANAAQPGRVRSAQRA